MQHQVKTRKITIRLPESLLGEVENRAIQSGMERDFLIKIAVKPSRSGGGYKARMFGY